MELDADQAPKPPSFVQIYRTARKTSMTATERPDLLLTGKMLPVIEENVDKHFTVHRLADAKNRDAFLTEISPRVRAIATGGQFPVTAAIMEKMPKLEIVSNFGVGYDSVDSKWAGEHGIVVTNTPDVLNDEVADTTVALLLNTLRELPRAEKYLRAGRWGERPYPLTNTLRDRTIGIVGMGRIGKTIAKRLDGFDRPIAYHSRKPASGVPYKHYPDLIAMAKDVDVLFAIVPGGPATKNMINAEVLKALGPNGVLINVARGSVVDEPALIEALKNKTILAAGLDVFAEEPKVPQALTDMDHVVLLPHVASATHWTRRAMGQLVLDNLTAWAAGKDPVTPVVETPWPPKKK
jgi:lactate dehydrogenase-like 2-hydroxyacid dehydrogenase